MNTSGEGVRFIFCKECGRIRLLADGLCAECTRKKKPKSKFEHWQKDSKIKKHKEEWDTT